MLRIQLHIESGKAFSPNGYWTSGGACMHFE